MILILSKNVGEISTEEVMDWLFAMNVNLVRLNGEDLLHNKDFEFTLCSSSQGWSLKLGEEQIRAVWYRRGFDDSMFDYESYVCSNRDLIRFAKFMEGEFASIYKLLELSLSHVPWLSRRSGSVNKLTVLLVAVQVGLKIPETRITNRYLEVAEELHQMNKPIVTKAIQDSIGFCLDEEFYLALTSCVSINDITTTSEVVYPTLFQRNVQKRFEIRSFFIEDRFYSMAIFSQGDAKTRTDFRNYNDEKPNRCVPYVIPHDVEVKLKALLNHFELETASIDLIYSIEGEYVFLEINPVGQFGMVSHPCNYYLEEEVAKYLIKKAEHGIHNA